jgi:hypothetical protein
MTVPPPPTPPVPARFGKVGFWLAVATLLLATVLPAIGALVFLAGGLDWAGGGQPSGYGGVALAAIVGLLVITAVPWLTAFPATVLGIVSLARRERPAWWGVVALLAIPIAIICWLIADAVA